MINIKKVMMAAVVLLLIGGIGSVITFFTMERHPIQQSSEVDAAHIKALDISQTNGAVIIQQTDDPVIRVELTGVERNPSHVELLVNEKGDTLTVETSKPNRSRFHLFPKVKDLRLTVYVPDNTLEQLQVEVSNGRLDGRQFKVGQMTALVHNGRIYMEDITVDEVNAGSNNGKIEMHDVSGDITGTTHNGSITLVTSQLEQNIDMGTNNGSIKIMAEHKPTNATIDARAHNGKIRIFGQKDWTSILGQGEHRIKLRTDNGSITLEQNVNK